MHDPEKQIYPHVLASTASGPVGSETRDTRYFAQAVTNNQDTIIRTAVYWYIPEEGEPVLMVEIDDEWDINDRDVMDVKIRVRRNDGLVYEGTRATQEERCELCGSPVAKHAGAEPCDRIPGGVA